MCREGHLYFMWGELLLHSRSIFQWGGRSHSSGLATKGWWWEMLVPSENSPDMGLLSLQKKKEARKRSRSRSCCSAPLWFIQSDPAAGQSASWFCCFLLYILAAVKYSSLSRISLFLELGEG